MTEIIRFLAWPYPKKKLLFQVLYLVVSVRIGLWVFLTKYTSMSDSDLPDGLGEPDWASIHQVVAYVRYCSRFVPHASCLTQALATRIALRRMGQNCSLKIGVDKDQNHKFLAHAWIEVDGEIIIGKVPDIRRYSIMAHNREQLV